MYRARSPTKLFGYVGAITPFGTPYASSNDPLFFPLHNVYIRLWAQQVLTLGGEFNTTWSDGPQVECVGHSAGHPVMDFDMPIGPHLPAGQYNASEVCAAYPEDPLCTSGYYATTAPRWGEVVGRARGGLMGIHGHPPLCMLRYEDASAEKWLRWPAPCQTELVQERLWPSRGVCRPAGCAGRVRHYLRA